MKIEVYLTTDFKKNIKRLKKRYRSLPSDIENLQIDLLENPYMGKDLGKGVHKIRLAIKSKGKGKRGGARIITHNTILTHISTHRIVLLTMWDKSDKESLSDKEIIALLRKNDLI